MPINQQDILDLVYQIAQEEDLQVTVKESAKAAAIVGLTCFLGGITLGPPGLFIGGALGGLGMSISSRNKFRSAVVILQELPYERQQRLVTTVQDIVSSIDATDLAMLSLAVMSNSDMRCLVLQAITTFMTNDLGYSLRQN